jgi:hypothetical protein
MRKVFIDIVVKVKKDGTLIPLSIEWEDGKTYEIDRVLESKKAASLKVGGCGLRFTLKIHGKQTYVFYEDGKWFVEAK